MSVDETDLTSRHNTDAIALGLKRRDPVAAGQLVDRFGDALYQYALYRVRDTHVAEDIMADVLARVIEKIDSYVPLPAVPFTAWVFRIAHNRVIDYYRTQAKQREQSLDNLMWSADVADESGTFSADETFTQAITSRHVLLAALADLPEDQRRVVVQRFIEGRDLEEVASRMAKTVSAVKALQFRAVQTLRQRLTEEERMTNEASARRTGGHNEHRQYR